MKNSVSRQLIDIQLQAERLIQTQADETELYEFGRYSEELKSYLAGHVNDEFIQKKLSEIPKIDDMDIDYTLNSGILATLLFYLSFGLTSYFVHQRRNQLLRDNVREIKNKFSSIEFLMKNYSF